jgi:CxxC motif-containing protein (DUF1111 family)
LASSPSDPRRDGDGISGRAQIVPDPSAEGRTRLGRFGWKAEKISVAHQVAAALSADMGVSTPMFPEPDGHSELSQRDFRRSGELFAPDRPTCMTNL